MINWNRRKYSQQDFEEAVRESFSWFEVARRLGLHTGGGGIFQTLKKTAAALETDFSHFTGSGWNKGDKFGLAARNTIPLEDILIKGSTYNNTGNLKKRLISSGLLVEECSAPFCPMNGRSLNPWTGESVPLKLALDHINGVRDDNRIENLRLLCYHCHGLTETFCGKNRNNRPA